MPFHDTSHCLATPPCCMTKPIFHCGNDDIEAVILDLIWTIPTVNIDIFAQLNFRASSPMRHIRAVKFSRICYFYLFYYDYNFHSHQIFAHLKPCANTRKYVLRENFYVYSIQERRNRPSSAVAALHCKGLFHICNTLK